MSNEMRAARRFLRFMADRQRTVCSSAPHSLLLILLLFCFNKIWHGTDGGCRKMHNLSAIQDANETGGGESVVVGGREEKSGQADNLHFPTIQLTWLHAALKAHLQRIQIVWQIVSQAQVRIMAE